MNTSINQWPVVRWEERKQRWKADARTKNGGGIKLFETREEADAWAKAQRLLRKEHGDSGFALAFSGPPTTRNSKDDIWPVIRWEERRQAWRVDARTKNGGGFKFFAIRGYSKEQVLSQAQAFAEAQRIKRGNEGSDAFNLPAAARIDATAALDIIARSATPNVTLRECVNFWFKHHKVASGNKTVREVVDELLATKKTAGLSERYLRDLRSRLGIFARAYGEEKIIDISAPQVDAYVLGLPNLNATSRNNHRVLLRVLFNFAIDSGYLLEVPITKKSKSKQKYGKPNIFTVEEAARLLSCCEDDILPAVALGLFTGLRPEAELWRLDWSKIHLDRKKIDVDETKDKGDHASVRWVDIPDVLVAWLLPYRKASGPICPLDRSYYSRIRKAKKAAGINRRTPDGLRHSFCSYHYALYQDAGLTSAQAGHTNLKTFFRHYRQRVLREDAERFFSITPTDDQAKIVPIAAA
jgi:integrase